ncbi:MAG: nucleotide exchange factor GrpE [Candidatus Contendobacter sp.]|nr:nucleotide exchange factor GrpE [Candidatus Contendobacter sp.]MDS4058451.1 nucleotide exchange factor GrpE [Candidatus Contendobacter sp.]
MDIEIKEQLLGRFRAYLDELPDATLADRGEENRQTDLYSLFGELLALKNEVRLESRQVKTALDEFRAVFETLQASQAQLGGELDRTRAALPEQRRAIIKPVLLELAELHDRLEAGLRVLRNYRPTVLSRLFGLGQRERALLQAITQEQDISLRRLEQLLISQQVVALSALGQPLDPHTMRAAEVEQRREVGNGIVTEELRRGYLWQGELLRLAEVKVNHRPEPPAPTVPPSTELSPSQPEPPLHG